MAMTYNDYECEVYESAKDVIDEEIDHLMLHFDSLDEIYFYLLEHPDVTGVTGDGYTLTEDEAADNVAHIIWTYQGQNVFLRMGYDSVPLQYGPEYVDAEIRKYAFDNVWYQLASDCEDMMKECDDLRATRYLMDHAHVSEDTAQFLIEWWADDPMPWAEMYAPRIRELTSEDSDPETWEKRHPYDTVIVDAGFNAPAVIISEDVVNYY